MRRIAARHSVCPYYLAQEMVRWADVVVGDFNHFFDPNATLRGFLGYAGWSQGQLEGEMRQQTWFVADPANFNLVSEDGPGLWRLVLGALDPELKLLADEPEDPSRN